MADGSPAYQVKARKKDITEAVIPAVYNGLPVTRIADSGFVRCENLVSVTIPDSVTEIGIRAFSGCQNLAEVTLSEGLKTIGENAFLGCTALKEIEIPASAEEIAENAFGSDTNVIFKEKEEAA